MTHKNFTSSIAHSSLKAKVINTNKVSPRIWEVQQSFEMLLGRFKVYVLSQRTITKIWKFIHFSDSSLVFQLMLWRKWRKLSSKSTLYQEIGTRVRSQSLRKRKISSHGSISIVTFSFYKCLRPFHSKWGICDSKSSLNLVIRMIIIG